MLCYFNCLFYLNILNKLNYKKPTKYTIIFCILKNLVILVLKSTF